MGVPQSPGRQHSNPRRPVRVVSPARTVSPPRLQASSQHHDQREQEFDNIGAAPVFVEGVVVGHERHSEREGLSVTYNEDPTTGRLVSETWENTGLSVGADSERPGDVLDRGVATSPGWRVTTKCRAIIGSVGVLLIIVVVVVVIIGGGNNPRQTLPRSNSAGAGTSSPPPPPPPSPPPPTPQAPPPTPAQMAPSATAEIVVSGDIANFGVGTQARAAFEQTFERDVATALGIPSSNVDVADIRGGSLVVVTKIFATDSTPAFTLLQQLTTSASDVANPLVLAGQSVVEVSTSGNTLGEVGQVTLSQNAACTSAEREDNSGNTCEMFVSHGYSCFNMVHMYGYDCRCTCDSSSEVIQPIGWQTVSFGRSYSNPVVILGLATYDDVGDAFLRLQNVTKDSFQVGLQESRCQDRQHNSELVSWMVVEAGSLHSGPTNAPLLQAGTVTLAHGENLELWQSVSIDEWPTAGGSLPPVVLAQLMTTYEISSPAWTRVSGVSASGFQIALQEDIWDGGHMIEQAGWLAFARSTTTSAGDLSATWLGERAVTVGIGMPRPSR